MYQNSDVNQELRERLPRASKTDPLKKGQEGGDISEGSKSDPFKSVKEVTDTEESSIEEQIVVEVEEQAMRFVPKTPNNADTQNYYCNYPKIWLMWNFQRELCPEMQTE